MTKSSLFIILLFLISLQSAAQINYVKNKTEQGSIYFAFKSFQQLQQTQKSNFAYSPLCLSYTMSQIYLGTSGKTGNEIANSLRFFDKNVINADTYKKLYDRLVVDTKNNNSYISFENNFIFENKIIVNKNFNNLLFNYFNIKRDSILFVKDINTNINNINFLLKQKKSNIEIKSTFDSLQNVLNVSCLNICASWKNEFNEKSTKKDTFFLENGRFYITDFMVKSELVKYSESDKMKILRMPLDNGLSVSFIIPKAGIGLKEVETKLIPEEIDFWSISSRYVQVDIAIPKFFVKSEINFKNNLINMGVSNLFVPNYNFLTITKSKFNFSEIYQSVEIDINESGINKKNINKLNSEIFFDKNRNEQFIANKPFVYIIREDKTGLILLIGKYITPYKND